VLYTGVYQRNIEVEDCVTEFVCNSVDLVDWTKEVFWDAQATHLHLETLVPTLILMLCSGVYQGDIESRGLRHGLHVRAGGP